MKKTDEHWVGLDFASDQHTTFDAGFNCLGSMKNKYAKRSKISEAKFRQIIRYFSLELDSQKIALLTRLNRNTVNRYLGRIRRRIAEICEAQAPPPLNGAVSPANSSGPPPTRSRSGTLALPVIGIRSENDRVYTKILSNDVHRWLRRLVANKPACELRDAPPGEWASYDDIVDLNSRRHYRVARAAPLATAREEEGIDGFLSFARKRLMIQQYTGPDLFHIGLKECEFRYNHRKENLYQLLLEQFRTDPLS